MSKTKKKSKQFTITLNERQLELLAYACRVTDRLIIGQLDFSLQECCERAFDKLHKDDKPYNRTEARYKMQAEVREVINKLRELCWGVDCNQNYGIHYDEAADVLFDMQKVIEHALWLEEDPKTRCKYTNNAFEHTIEYGKEKNIIVKLCHNDK